MKKQIAQNMVSKVNEKLYSKGSKKLQFIAANGTGTHIIRLIDSNIPRGEAGSSYLIYEAKTIEDAYNFAEAIYKLHIIGELNK